MATNIWAYVIETDGSVHEMISAGDSDWKDEEVGNILTDVFSNNELSLLEGGDEWFNYMNTN